MDRTACAANSVACCSFAPGTKSRVGVWQVWPLFIIQLVDAFSHGAFMAAPFLPV